MNLDELREKRKLLEKECGENFEEARQVAKESKRVQEIASNTPEIVASIDREFERITALNNVDIAFLMFATMMQTLRWVLLPELKLTQIDKLEPSVSKDNRLAANERKHIGGVYDGKKSGAEYELEALEKYRKKHPDLEKKTKEEFYQNKNHYRSWIEILSQPVPYDAMNAKDKKLIPNIANLNKCNLDGSFNNIYGNNHHVATLGHDPMLGWVFGTANIMTSTISFVDFQSFRVNRGHRIKSQNTFDVTNQLQFSDQIIDYAIPCGLFEIFFESAQSAQEDCKRIVAAVVRQAIHMASDKYCVEGLPFPLMSVIDSEKAQELIEKGWNSVEFERLLKKDLSQIGISAGISVLINLIIEAIYLLCLSSEDSIEIRRVKVNKILSLSGVIAESSNVLYVTLTKYISKLDVGGISVLMLELLHSEKFISDVKQEFILKNFERLVMEGNNE